MIGRLVLMGACCVVIVAVTFFTLRAIQARDVCGTVDKQAVAIRALIVDGTKQTKPFERLIVENGGPPYAERLARAYRDAASIPGCPESKPAALPR